MDEQLTKDRPWPVYVLVAAWILGAIWSVAFQDGSLGPRIASSAISIVFAFALWKGARWVFTVWFMLLSLCVGMILLVLFVQTVLFSQDFDGRLLWPLAISAVFMALLMHPETKRFARVEDTPVTVEAT